MKKHIKKTTPFCNINQFCDEVYDFDEYLYNAPLYEKNFDYDVDNKCMKKYARFSKNYENERNNEEY